MRTSFFFFILGSAILTITGCKKDPGATFANGSNTNDNTSLKANAGGDILVFLPADSCSISWSASSHSRIESGMWRKISGPSSIKIRNPDLHETRVNDLTQGIYELELTVTNNAGLKDTDTMSLIVGVLSSREHSIKNISWSAEGAFGIVLWGAFLTVKNIYSFFPVGSVFKVFVRKETSGILVEAKGYWSPGSGNARYTFSIFDSNLHVWSGEEEGGTAEIMLVY